MKCKLKNPVKGGIGALFLLVLMLVGATQARAQKNYGLRVAGVKVTSENCDDLSGIPGVSGIVNYDTITHTLYLENATIEANDNSNGIFSSVKGLTINVTGENNITTLGTAISSEESLTINGGGTLNAESSENIGIKIFQPLEISNCTVNAKGNKGIAGYDTEKTTLTISYAIVTAEGNEGSICNIASLTLDGCYISTPQDAAFDETMHAVALNGETVTDKIVTEKSVRYGLLLAGVEVTDKNCNDLSEIPGVSGTAKYNPDTKTLTLDNATIAAEGSFWGITNDTIEGLIINVTGENRVTAEYPAMNLNYNPTIIKGNGILNIESSNGAGIYFQNSLEIDSCTVNIKGAYGFIGDDGTSENLTIRNADVTAEGTKGSICDIKSLTLDGSVISTPEGAAFDETLHAVVLDGKVVTDKIVIEKGVPINYGLQIAGVDVTNKNCNDLSVIEGVNGKVTFDPETNTLTLDNATINTPSYRCIVSSIDSLIINLIGENKLITDAAAISLNYTPTIIKGEGGTLNIESRNSGIYFKNSLEIDSCTVNIQGRYGITGNNGTSENLTISNAYVTAEGYLGSICDIKSLTLDGSVISTPEGAAFDETKHAVVLNGNTVTEKIVITPDATVGIKDGKAKVSAHKQGIYSIDGVYLGNDFDSLPKGIYIKDGKKVLK